MLPILGRGSMDRRFPLVDCLIADGADTVPVTSSENDEVLLLGV